MSRAPGSYAGLTVMQANLLSFLRHCEAANRCPSYDEMCDHLGLKSRSGSYHLIRALEERGYVTRLPNRARSIVCTERPLSFYATGKLISELESRGYRFFGQSAEAA